jgi:hypothetical protein
LPATYTNFLMRYLFNFCCVVIFLVVFGCSRSSSKTIFSSTGAVIEFETTVHDFGIIPHKGDGVFEFAFKSKGEEPLVLKNVKPSCGCTIPEWPKDPIIKGDKGSIKVSYNTRISGTFSKSVSVYSNASEKPIVLIVKGKVEEEKLDNSTAPSLE